MKRILMVILCSMIVGCSSKPDVADAEPYVSQYWKACEFIKPTNFEKTNGVEHENSYELIFSYELELITDLPERSDCWLLRERERLLNAIAIQNNINRTFVKGDKMKVVGASLNLVRSENGWIVK